MGDGYAALDRYVLVGLRDAAQTVLRCQGDVAGDGNVTLSLIGISRRSNDGGGKCKSCCKDFIHCIPPSRDGSLRRPKTLKQTPCQYLRNKMLRKKRDITKVTHGNNARKIGS